MSLVDVVPTVSLAPMTKQVVVVVVVVVFVVADVSLSLSCCYTGGVPRTTDHALPTANPLLRLRF